jgi:predicted GNAT family acetyltransferase
MTLVIATDAATVAGLADALVEREPVAYTVFGSIAKAVRDSDAAPWAAYPAGSPSVLAARSQPFTTVGFSEEWTDVTEVSEEIAALDPRPVGISGPPGPVAEVHRRLGTPVTGRMDERLFRLDELVAPVAPEGFARLATLADAGWLARWYTDFAVEAFGRTPPGFDAAMERRIMRSRCWIWVGADGLPRSIAVAQSPVVGVSRIGPVYTPPDARGRGYGSAATAAASRDILDAGDVACLYTDLANPTSNKIYQQLGYRAVLDRATVRFD